MPEGKPAGMRCIQLDEQNRCKIFGLPSRPAVCSSLMPEAAMCGDSQQQAMAWLTTLEHSTCPPATSI